MWMSRWMRPLGLITPRHGLARSRAASAALSVAELIRDHHLELVRLAVVVVGDLATAEDVVQDCLQRLHGRWHVIREPSPEAFEWQPSAADQAARYRALPLSSKPADLLTASKHVAAQRAESTDYVPNALVTPDGRTVVTSE
jgi:Sigma-70 region 2